MIKKIKIGNNLIGEGEPTFIVAEIGSNHDRKFEQALKLIDIATEAGADAVKFQIFNADEMYSEKSPYYKPTKKLEFPRVWIKELYDYCKEKGIIFLATPFDLDAVDKLEEVGVEAYKIASFEITYLPLLEYVAKTGKPIILSTGMANISDIEKALEIFYRNGNKNIILLRCISSYPSNYNNLNLKTMESMRQMFQIPIGFSDHTVGITAGIVAVSLGANVVEKHFTVDRNLEGPDHKFGLEPDELKSMVKEIRNAEKSIGINYIGCTESEKEMYKLRRKYIKDEIYLRDV